jgi:hypothetical protein
MRQRGSKGFGRAALGACLVAMVVPAGAAAAPAKPSVTTGGTANLAPTSVVLNGTVDPNEVATTYFFQYGTTSLYGAQTAATGAGAGAKAIRVSVPVAGLAPATRYHYRLIAQNARGLVKGKDRTFRTRRQPLGVTLAAAPNPIRSGSSTTLAGTLTGTGNAGRQVALQANPFPYTQGFQNVGNAQVTDAQGGFQFPLLAVAFTTQYRVLMPSRPEVVSPVVVLGAQVKVTTHVRTSGRRVRFSGSIRPGTDGAEVLIQRRRNGRWLTAGRTFARHSSSTSSRYVKSVRRRSARFRVLVNVQGAYVASEGHTKRVRG